MKTNILEINNSFTYASKKIFFFFQIFKFYENLFRDF